MANPDKLQFALLGRPPYTGLIIGTVRPDGSLDATLLGDNGDREVIGKYDDNSRVISFNDAEFPGLVLNTTFFNGTAMSGPGGNVVAFHGTWRDQELTFSPARKMVQVKEQDGRWMAINPTPVIP